VLPSCGETGEPAERRARTGCDVASVRDVLTASDEPTVVVAHSYGGIVTAEAATGVDCVRQLLFVSTTCRVGRASLIRRSTPSVSRLRPTAARSPSEWSLVETPRRLRPDITTGH